MFDPHLRAGLTALLCVLAAGIGGCDARGTVHSAAQATEAWSDHGKVIIWHGMHESREDSSNAQAEGPGAPTGNL